MDDVAQLLDRIWRADAAGMLGALSRRLGDFGWAEEALSDASAEALKRWPEEGVPNSPTGWLVTTGWHKAIDRLRRDAVGRQKMAQLAVQPPPEPGVDDRPLTDRLAGYHLWHAARADLLATLDRRAEALAAAEHALELATNPAERELMSRRVGELGRRL